MELHIFDVSQYIASGSKSLIVANGIIEDSGPFRSAEMPCGGVAYLLNTIYEFRNKDTELVYCYDRTPTVKRAMHERTFPNAGGYKGFRPKRDYSITVQRQLAEEIIKQIGLNTVAVDSLEADDCIASIIEYYKDSYENIYIHSKDSDLYYLVCNNVQIAPLCKPYSARDRYGNVRSIINGKTINMSNWESEVVKDEIMPYNLLTIDKMCKGDYGDNIPKISRNMKDIILGDIMQRPELYNRLGSMEFLREYICSVTKGDARTKDVMELIIPVIAKPEEVELNVSDLDVELLNYYAKKFGCKYAKKFALSDNELGSRTIDKYIDMYMNEGGDTHAYN